MLGQEVDDGAELVLHIGDISYANGDEEVGGHRPWPTPAGAPAWAMVGGRGLRVERHGSRPDSPPPTLPPPISPTYPPCCASYKHGKGRAC